MRSINPLLLLLLLLFILCQVVSWSQITKISISKFGKESRFTELLSALQTALLGRSDPNKPAQPDGRAA